MNDNTSSHPADELCKLFAQALMSDTDKAIEAHLKIHELNLIAQHYGSQHST